MSYEFFDTEPEDAWSPGDRIRELIDNLRQRLALLGEHTRISGHADDHEWVEELTDRLEHWRRTRTDTATERDFVRANDIARHIEVIRERIGG